MSGPGHLRGKCAPLLGLGAVVAATAAGDASGAVSVDWTAATGILVVSSDGAADAISVDCPSPALVVEVNGVPVLDGADPVPCSLVQGLTVAGGAGGDAIVLAGLLTQRWPLLWRGVANADEGDDTIDGATAEVGLNLDGGGGRDVVRGGAGPDALAGGLPADDDTLEGGAGIDGLSPQGGDDSLDGGANGATLGLGLEAPGTATVSDTAADTPTSHHVLTSITGLVLGGSTGDDVLVLDGFNGSGTVSGGGGTDVLRIARDADALLAYGGKPGTPDFLNVGTSALRLIGVRPELTGGPGANRLDASAYPFPATLAGGGGDDTLLAAWPATPLASRLEGGDGADSLVGGASADHLLGGAGDDTLVGGGGAVDLLDGGEGSDLVRATGDGSYTLSASALAGATTAALVSVERAAVQAGPGANRLSVVAFPGAATLDGAGGGDAYDVAFAGDGSGSTTIADTGADGVDSLALARCEGVAVDTTSARLGLESVAFSGLEALPCGFPPAPAPPPAPALLATIGRPLRLARDGLAALVPVVCVGEAVGSCRGTVSLAARVSSRALGRKGPARPIAIAVGSAAFVDVRPGRTRAVVVPLRALARRALARLGALPATVTVRATDGRDEPRATVGTRALRAPRR